MGRFNDLNAYQMAHMAGCASPDRLDSPGAGMLNAVADGVNELLDYAGSGWTADASRLDDDGAVHEIADGAPSVYTYTKWQQFVDLGAWQEDVTDYGPVEDMDSAATNALYMIAERLAWELVNYAVDAEDGPADD